MHDDIESHLVETRVFQPSRDFSSKARIKSLAQYRRMHRESIRQPAKFWAREASELVWRARWKKVLQWKPPFAKWFVGGKLNISENCLDRHLSPEGLRGNKAAIIWEGEPGDKRTLTYQQLHREVCRFAMERLSGAWSFFAEPETTSTWRREGMFGGIGSWSMSMRTVQLCRSIVNTPFTFCTRADPLENRKEFCTRRAAI